MNIHNFSLNIPERVANDSWVHNKLRLFVSNAATILAVFNLPIIVLLVHIRPYLHLHHLSDFSSMNNYFPSNSFFQSIFFPLKASSIINLSLSLLLS